MNKGKKRSAGEQPPSGFVSACEVPSPGKPVGRPDRRDPNLLKFEPGFLWEGVNRIAYKKEEGGGELPFAGVDRQELLGMNGEPASFHLRYFEVAPGGHTSHEKHGHVHAIVPIRGAGEIRIGDRALQAAPYDVVYVPPLAAHQVRNPGPEPFGFLCIVDAARDRPRPAEEEGP